MQQAFRAADINIPRVTYDQVNFGDNVSMDNPRPGDLVFNAGNDRSDARPGHVGMYIGDGKIIEAPRTGVRTRIVSYSSWRNSTSTITRITEVRRVVKWWPARPKGIPPCTSTKRSSTREAPCLPRSGESPRSPLPNTPGPRRGHRRGCASAWP
ncbi:C40 family peptidase [Streptomyces sp. NBC_01363]|uniref:C40 family peptidase n=1 Tax=Streptomyces sp. NBC_01363 TaxID=2903840 RepID=UPI00224E90F8|nr:NlpC/P60 family protein [Streptomyces sp. NBC_01363]MCX4734440.1 C40 family peptidase [Streptomyces sp. NBC_01363]